MARKTARPGRTVVVFFLGLAIAYGLVALGGTWKPELGLDLQGGTRITLTAKGSPSSENLDEARGIIDQRVNGTGVTEAEVTTQGGNLIVVEIPGKTRSDLVDTVKRQAQLRFRTVACTEGPGGVTGACASAATALGAPAPSRRQPRVRRPRSKPSAKSTASSSKNRAPFLMADKKSDKKSQALVLAELERLRRRRAPSASPSASPSSAPSDSGDPAQSALAFIDNPDQAAVEAFNKYSAARRTRSSTTTRTSRW